MSAKVSQPTQVIRRTFRIQDRSLEALNKMGVPRELWNEIRALPAFTSTTIVESPSPKPATPPPAPVVTEPTENENVTSEDFKKEIRDNILNYYEWLESYPSYWQDEIAKNTFRRFYYHKKSAWSPKDLVEIHKIDKRIAYCEMRLEKILKNQPINEDDNEEYLIIDDDVSIIDVGLDDEF